MCGFCNVWVYVGVGVCMCGFCNVWLCVCVRVSTCVFCNVCVYVKTQLHLIIIHFGIICPVTLPRCSYTDHYQMTGDITTLNVEFRTTPPNVRRRHYTVFSVTEAQMIYLTDKNN
jgi:hypothetical protein